MKVVLLLDKMPEACGLCQFSERGYQPHCIASGRTHAINLHRADRPDWCPLKPMDYYNEVMEKVRRLEKELFE